MRSLAMVPYSVPQIVGVPLNHRMRHCTFERRLKQHSIPFRRHWSMMMIVVVVVGDLPMSCHPEETYTVPMQL